MDITDIKPNKSSPVDSPSDAADLPTPVVKLSAREKKVWNHLVKALQAYGMVHRTDAMALTVIAQTFCELEDITAELEEFKASNGGNVTITSKNGWLQPHALFYAIRDKKKELLTWLQEASLTISTFERITAKRVSTKQRKETSSDPLDDFMSTRPD